MVDSMEIDPPAPKATSRHKCFACFKQFKKKEHLVEHMKISFHSPHQPICGVCRKHCKSFESLREHLNGPLSKPVCSEIFSAQGCDLCMKFYETPNILRKHEEMCCLSAPAALEAKMQPPGNVQIDVSRSFGRMQSPSGSEAIAMDCEMVGGGTDGPKDICARVCLVDEDENIIFHTYVKPQFPVTDYRFEITGLTEEHLSGSPTLREVQEKVLYILSNGEPAGSLTTEGSKARLLVGHGLEHDLDCLRMKYPAHLLRDTAKYRPLMKTNLVSHSLKYLTKKYLGYDIQTGSHDPYEDCVAAMRLYKRMRSGQDHQPVGIANQTRAGGYDSWKPEQLEKMTPKALYEISQPDYRCWCLDSRPPSKPG